MKSIQMFTLCSLEFYHFLTRKVFLEMLIDVLELHKLTLAVMEKQSILNHKKKKTLILIVKKMDDSIKTCGKKLLKRKCLLYAKLRVCGCVLNVCVCVHWES